MGISCQTDLVDGNLKHAINLWPVWLTAFDPLIGADLPEIVGEFASNKV